MAKKENWLSLEEKVIDALVPEDEKPYEVPENWCWTKIGSVCKKIHYGYTVSASDTGNAKLLRITDIQEDMVYWNDVPRCDISDREIGKYILNNGDIVFARTGATVGKSYLVENLEESTVFASYLIRLIPFEQIENKFLKYLFNSNLYWNQISDKAVGTGQPNVNATSLSEIIIPLPPLEEQKRIVEQIENLFCKLDEAKDGIEMARNLAKNLKSSLIAKGLKGTLTAEWRKRNNIDIADWSNSVIMDMCTQVKAKYSPEESEEQHEYIGLEHIAKGNGIISKGLSGDVKSTKTMFQSGDVLYGRLRPYLDKHDVVNFNGICSTDILAFRTNCKNNNRFLNYIFSMSKFIDYAISNSKGINLPRISEKEILLYKIKLPSFKEQIEIVEILDEELSKISKILENLDMVDSFELLKKSILSKAFRGELSTTDLSESSSIEILKKILSDEK